MSDVKKQGAGPLFWGIAIIALLWNAMGVMSYIGSHFITESELIAAYGDEGAKILANTPIWATAAYAVAVFAGLLGSIGLLLRKKWAFALFSLSLICVVVHHLWGHYSGGYSVTSAAEKIIGLLVLLLAVFFVWWSRKKAADGTLV